MLRARFEDAQFFYAADLARRLEELRPKLAGTTFQADLGSLLDKSERVERLVAPLAAAAGLTGALFCRRRGRGPGLAPRGPEGGPLDEGLGAFGGGRAWEPR